MRGIVPCLDRHFRKEIDFSCFFEDVKDPLQVAGIYIELYSRMHSEEDDLPDFN